MFLNDLSVGGVLTAPNINLTGLTTLNIGNALIGNSPHPAFNGDAIFCHKNFNNSTDYMIAQDGQNGRTYVNCKAGTDILFSKNNNQRMKLRDDGTYNMFLSRKKIL